MKGPWAVVILLLLALGACAAWREGLFDRPIGPVRPLPAWTPSLGQRWQIQLAGQATPQSGVTYYDLDPFTTHEDTVSRLDGNRRHTICHLDVGTTDLSLPGASSIPSAVIGAPAGDGRRWLDIRDWKRLKPVFQKRFQLCRSKGFEGVDADLAFGYAYDSGFPLTEADQLAFDRKLIGLAHRLHLEIAVRTSADLQPKLVSGDQAADFAVVQGCVAQHTCDAYRPYVTAHKTVLDLESGSPSEFCPTALYYRFAALAKPEGTDAATTTYC